MIVTKSSEGVPPKKGPWLLVHGPLVLAQQIHSSIISFGFDTDWVGSSEPKRRLSDRSDDFLQRMHWGYTRPSLQLNLFRKFCHFGHAVEKVFWKDHFADIAANDHPLLLLVNFAPQALFKPACRRYVVNTQLTHL